MSFIFLLLSGLYLKTIVEKTTVEGTEQMSMPIRTVHASLSAYRCIHFVELQYYLKKIFFKTWIVFLQELGLLNLTGSVNLNQLPAVLYGDQNFISSP